jgi:hypothetical protein
MNPQRRQGKNKPVRGPVVDLDAVRKLLPNAFVNRRRARCCVEHVLGKTSSEAIRLILSEVGKLQPGDRVTSEDAATWEPPVRWDIYSISRRTIGSWYIKLYVHQEQLHIVSFHPPEHDQRTTAGVAISKGSKLCQCQP